MMNLIIIDEDSRINGIGTYLRDIILIFKQIGAIIYRVNHNNTLDVFSVKKNDEIITFSFSSRLLESYNKIIDKFLGLYIADSKQNLFMLNYTPCEDLIRTLKRRFPLSKIVFTVHDLCWTTPLMGDIDKLKYMVSTEFCKESGKEGIDNISKVFMEEKHMFQLSDAVIVLAGGTRRVLTEVYGIDPKKIHLIPNGLQDTYKPVSRERKQEIRSAKFLSGHEKILLFAGRVHYMKGVYSLIRSFSQVLQIYPECRLVIAGFLLDPPKVLSLTGNAASKIIFTGQIPKKELDEWISITDIGILPSYTEQCCYWGIELMMHGVPVITTDGFNLQEMFAEGYNAGIVKIGDREDAKIFEYNLADEIVKLLHADAECRKLGEQGRRVYETRYTSESMYTGYKTLIDTLFSNVDK